MAKNDYLRDLLNDIKLRYQLDNGQLADDFHPLSITQQFEENLNSQQLEFDLQLRLFEAKKLTALLEKLSFKSEQERFQWLDKHQHFVNQLSQLIIRDSNLSLMALRNNKEHSQLSILLADEIKKAISLMNTIFFNNQTLNS